MINHPLSSINDICLINGLHAIAKMASLQGKAPKWRAVDDWTGIDPISTLGRSQSPIVTGKTARSNARPDHKYSDAAFQTGEM